MSVVAVVLNHRAPSTAHAFAETLSRLTNNTYTLDAATLSWDGNRLRDAHIAPDPVTHVAPPLLYGEPGAAQALATARNHGLRMLNSPQAIALADSKEASARRFADLGVAQPRTVILSKHAVRGRQWDRLSGLTWPLVVKRPEGSLGMWVRLCASVDDLSAVAAELSVEGPANLVVQEAVLESLGRAIRVLVLAGEPILATERVAPLGEWRSNVAQGANQHLTGLSAPEEAVARAAAAACNLEWAGVDIVRTASGPLVLEVNACPGFTSMQSHCSWSIADRVIRELLTR